MGPRSPPRLRRHVPKSAPVGSFFASRAYLGRSWALLGGYFSILGALGCLLGAIFAPSRVLKRFFAKFWRFGEVLARFGEGFGLIFSMFFALPWNIAILQKHRKNTGFYNVL